MSGEQKFERITREQIEEVRRATDIVDLIGVYVRLKSAGKNFLGLCPFHSEKTPSFVVSPQKQNFNCYGCGAHGDSIRFIIDIEHYQFIEAVKYLADRSGVQLTTGRSNNHNDASHNETKNCLKSCFDFFRNNLIQAPKDSTIQGYLKKREINPISISDFALGYVGEGWQNLHTILNHENFSSKIQESVGVIKKGEKGNYYDRLRNRLIFPIRDAQGRVLGFAGRALGEGEAKYLNPPETELYKKSSSFYGIYEAKEKIRQLGSAILVEGYLDVIRLHERGWNETIASCGTAVNEEHIKSLKRQGISKITLLFDGDNAGRTAAGKTAKLFLQNDLDSQVVILPDGLDPDDYFKTYGNDDFENLLKSADRDFDFLLNKVKLQLPELGMDAQQQLISDLVSVTNSISDPIKKDLFFNRASELYQVEKAVLKERVHTHKDTPEGAENRYSNFEVQKSSIDPQKTEVKLIQYLLNQVKSITRIRELVDPEEFEHQSLAIFYTRLKQLSDEEFMLLTASDFPELLVEHSALIMQLLQTGNQIKQNYYDPAYVDGLIYHFKLEKIERDLHSFGLDPEKKTDLLKSRLQIREKFKELPQVYKRRFQPM
ncbi:MAG: DNA primase [Proteobacteria bacterium]|nr:DNA primase [Pseudomonadota bacterium]